MSNYKSKINPFSGKLQKVLDEALITLGLDWQESVKDKDLDTPPGAPSDGDRYIVASGGLGDWAGHDDEIAQYNGTTSSWDFTATDEGTCVEVEDENKVYIYVASWVLFETLFSHGNLAGLQGGQAVPSEYYHLTLAQHGALHGQNTDTVLTTNGVDSLIDSGTLKVNLTVDNLITIDGRDLSVDGAKLDNIEANAVALATVKADVDIADAITKKHIAVTVVGAPLTLSGQQITFNYDSNDFQLNGNDLQIKDSGISHNSLADLQGGQANQYYHLTSAEHEELTTWLDSIILTSGGGITMSANLNLGGNDIDNVGNITVATNITDGVNSLTVAQAKTAYTHSQVVVGNPHSLTLTDLDSYNHNDLASIQGGQGGQYYHLNLSEYNELHEWLDSVILTSAGGVTLSGTLQLASGTSINEFSIDGTLVGNSDDAVPTEKAVKTYVDAQLSGKTHNGLSGLQGGQADQYYHLKAVEHEELTTWLDSIVLSSAGGITMSTNLDLGGNNIDNVGIIYGNSAYIRIGDAGTTAHSLASEDDLMVTGKLEVKGASYFDVFPITPSSAPTTDYQVANKKYVDDNAGGAKPDFVIDIPAGAFNLPASNPAPLDTDTGTNGTILRHLFDDTTEEFVEFIIKVPSDVDTSGTVTLQAYGYATIADGNEIQLRLSHIARDEGESWDNAYSTLDSADKVTDSDQDELDEVEWTETVSNLTWVADDLVRIKISRVAITDGTPVSGDWGLVHFRIRIPRT